MAESAFEQEALLRTPTTGTRAGDSFGQGISLGANGVVVGAAQEDSNATNVGGNRNDESLSNSGAAFLFP
jgi:hypothetical protein